MVIKNGYWATNDSVGQLFVSFCPIGYCRCEPPPGDLSGCLYEYDYPNKQCVDGRHGTLCGACIARRGLCMHSGECVKCDDKKSAIAKLVFLVIAVLVVACLVIYFNPNFSTKMRGPTFYTQVLPYIYNSNGMFGEIVRGIASVTALGGPAGLPFGGCLSEEFDKLDENALTYVFAGVIVLVLASVYVLDRFYVLHFKRDSPFEAFWILLVGIYVFFSETSLMFYFCVPIGRESEYYAICFFYNASYICLLCWYQLQTDI